MKRKAKKSWNNLISYDRQGVLVGAGSENVSFELRSPSSTSRGPSGESKTTTGCYRDTAVKSEHGPCDMYIMHGS